MLIPIYQVGVDENLKLLPVKYLLCFLNLFICLFSDRILSVQSKNSGSPFSFSPLHKPAGLSLGTVTPSKIVAVTSWLVTNEYSLFCYLY